MSRAIRRYKRSHQEAISEINVTPFVDILLVLLVAFMVTAPLLTASLRVDLPKGQDEAPVPEESPATLVVSVDQDRKVQVNEAEMKIEDLPAHLAGLAQSRREQPVHLRLDQNLPHSVLIDLMLWLKNAGYTRVGLVYEERAKGP